MSYECLWPQRSCVSRLLSVRNASKSYSSSIVAASVPHTLFWTTTDLERKLLDFQHYYNEHRTHAGRQEQLPETDINVDRSRANLSYRWQKHCRGLYQTPIDA
jgi:hypothetical protein